ncbi:putative ABC transport system ATP-binding protein [Oceanobacillus limi]|uniref:Putative ABC transport system ATP-binding protein n=1 Tax=Oceanobacillus limi TaxID=930131 RepID=A0A1I0C7J6_9BACI|nr:putative ABC transport system ATP-binding protein [Oceanobacillus limi]
MYYAFVIANDTLVFIIIYRFVLNNPTGNLDSETGRKIIGLLEGINANDGVTVVLITHDEAIAERTNQQIQLLDGKVREETLSEV